MTLAITNLFPNINQIILEDIQPGDWILFSSAEGIFTHRVYGVQVISNDFEVNLFYTTPSGIENVTLREVYDLYLVARDPLPYPTEIGTQLRVNVPEAVNALVVRNTNNRWQIIDPTIPELFGRVYRDSEVVVLPSEEDEDGDL